MTRPNRGANRGRPSCGAGSMLWIELKNKLRPLLKQVHLSLKNWSCYFLEHRIFGLQAGHLLFFIRKFEVETLIRAGQSKAGRISTQANLFKLTYWLDNLEPKLRTQNNFGKCQEDSGAQTLTFGLSRAWSPELTVVMSLCAEQDIILVTANWFVFAFVFSLCKFRLQTVWHSCSRIKCRNFSSAKGSSDVRVFSW